MKVLRGAVKHLLIQAIIAISWVGGASAASAKVLYEQPPQFLGGLASQTAPNFGFLYKAFDNFTLTIDGSITGIEWYGGYSNPPVEGTITQFEISFWSDNAGLPDQPLQTYVIPGNANEQFVASNSDFLDYHYTANLPTPFPAEANTTYWISIQPTLDFPPQWFWRDGTGGDGRAAQIVDPGIPLIPVAEDLAFTLKGVPLSNQIQISLDITPGSSENSINPRSKGVIPVAILTTDTFDAATVDPTTVLFGLTGTEAAPVQSALEDVDRDGDMDLILHFRMQATGIKCGATTAFLTGETFDGLTIEGSDVISTVGC